MNVNEMIIYLDLALSLGQAGFEEIDLILGLNFGSDGIPVRFRQTSHTQVKIKNWVSEQ